MNIGPIENADQLVRAEAERERFLSAAAYVRCNPAPPDIMEQLWLAQAEACEEIAREFEAEIADYRQRKWDREKCDATNP